MRFLTNLLNARRPTRRNGRSRHRSRDALVNVLQTEKLEDRSLLTAGWVDVIDGPGFESIGRMTGDAAGNTYITGSSDSATLAVGNLTLNNSGRDLFVAKANANGQIQWATRANLWDGYTTNESIGTNLAGDVAVDAQGDVYISGYFGQTIQFGAQSLTSVGDVDAFVAKLGGATGQFLWAQRIGGSGKDFGYSIAVDAAGNVAVSGSLNSSSELFVSKFDTNGVEQWTRTVTGSLNGMLSTVAFDATGNLYTAGRLNGTAQFPTGDLTSTATIPYNPGSIGNTVVAKLDSSGNWLWTRQIEGDTYGAATQVRIGVSGELYLNGWFAGTVNFDGTNFTSAGSMDLYVARMNLGTGAVDWARHIGSAGQESPGDLDVDVSGNIAVLGTIAGAAAFGSQTIVPEGTSSNFVTRLNSSGTFLESQRLMRYGARSVFVDASGDITIAGSGVGPVALPQQSITSSTGGLFLAKLPSAAATKFYVIDDGAIDRTFQYAASYGVTRDQFTLSSTNTLARGVATTAAGDKVWTVDLKGTVFVYTNTGALLGSWTPTGMSPNAVVNGITTNGTDIWVVDEQDAKVYKYAGAASRTSGTQAPASSFALPKANSYPTDLVTDGTSIWVVDENALKVFKYSMTGSAQGSWKIDAANKFPTGITLDPTNASLDLWIVDKGTDKIYQYTNGRTRTSGSQSASFTYALAVGNTSPQGIADPPPAGTGLAASPAVNDDIAIGDEDSTVKNVSKKSIAPTSKALSSSAIAHGIAQAAQSSAWDFAQTRGGHVDSANHLENPAAHSHSETSTVPSKTTTTKTPVYGDGVKHEAADENLNALLDLLLPDLLETGPKRHRGV